MIETLLASLLPGALAALVATAPADSSARPSTPAVAAAADSARPVTTLPAVEVRRERALLDGRRRLPTASVTDLRAGTSNRAMESLSEVLEASAGARIVQYGGLGAFSTLSLRGAPPGQVSVFLDGVPLTSAAHGVVDLSDLPVSAVERVEVYRGMAPLGFGGPTPGGAVNLVTAETPRVRALRVAGGSFGTWEGRGTLGATRGALSLLAHAGYQGSNGNYRYFSDNGTPFNLDDDEFRTRRNNRFDATSALARAAWAPRDGVRVSLRAEEFHKAQGLPGLGAVQAANPRLTFARTLGVLDAGFAPLDRAPGLTLRAHAQAERSRFRDPEGELQLGRSDTDEHFEDRGLAAEFASPRAWWLVSASAGVEARHEHATPSPPTLGQPVPAPSRRETASAHAGAQLHLVNDAVLLHAARRWDRQADHLRATLVAGAPYVADQARVLDAPQAGARVRLPRGFEARANWSKSSRAPEFLELFGNQGDVQGNPRLEPERGENWDAGGAWRGRGAGVTLALEFTRFASHVRQLITFVPAAQRSMRAANIARAEIRGEEVAWRLAWRRMAASGSYGWTSALQTDAGNIYYGRRLPQRPERQAYARIDAGRGPWNASVDVLELGDDFLDPINFTRVPGRTLIGASLSRAIGLVRVTLEGKNLGDRLVQDVGGYPLPGRSVFASCEAHFGGSAESQP